MIAADAATKTGANPVHSIPKIGEDAGGKLRALLVLLPARTELRTLLPSAHRTSCFLLILSCSHFFRSSCDAPEPRNDD